MKDDNDLILKEIALGLATLSKEQQAKGKEFVDLTLLNSEEVESRNLSDLVVFNWSAKRQHHLLVLSVLDAIAKSQADSEIEISPEIALKLCEAISDSASNGESEYAKIICQEQELFIFLFILYGIWSGSITGDSAFFEKFDKRDFQKDVIEGFWDRVNRK